MADIKITGYDPIAALADADLIEVIDDVAGTPTSKKSTWTTIKAFLKTYFDTLYAALAHKTRHQNGGADEINVGGLSGLLADDQHVLDAEVKAAVAHYVEFRILDKDTSHTTGTGKGGELRIPEACTVLDVGAYFDTAGTTSVTTIDINEAGTTILSTKITVDATEKSSKTAATAPVISDSAIAADAILTFDIDGIASGTAGKGLVVWMKVRF